MEFETARVRQAFDTAGLRRPLVEELSRGFDAASLWWHPAGILRALVLWRDDGSALSIQSKTFDVSANDWLEIGFLVFREDSEFEGLGERVPLPAQLRGELVAYKLVIVDHTDDGTAGEAESGLVLQSASKHEIIVVANAFPYSIAVKVDSIPHYFDPEYDLEKYERVLLS